MTIQKVIDNYGRDVEVDMDTKKIHLYSNKDKKIYYDVQKVENGALVDFWTEITINGIVDDIEERLNTWNNPVVFAYARAMDYRASDNDPNNEIWNNVVAWVKANPGECFNENGDWKKNIGIDPKTMKLKVVKA